MPSASPPAAPTIVHLLERNARIHADRPACYDKLSGSWVATSWRDLDAATRTFGRALVAGGVDAGDVVTILGANRPEWTIAALGAMRVGAIAAGIYTSSSPDEIAYILHHGESKLVVVEDADLLERVRAVWDRVPSLATVVLMRGAEGPGGDERILTWDEFAARAEGVDNAELDRRRDALRADQVADFIYTSGTTGPPKAVMLTHENLRWTAEALGESIATTADDVVISYLPLSHVAEQMSTIHIAISRAYQVYYCPDPLELAAYVGEVRPTVFFGVPRVWERFHAGIGARLAEATGAKAKIVAWARGVGSKTTALRNEGREPTGLLAVQDKLASKLVFDKLRSALGLDRTRAFVSGAAPLAVEILEFFGSLGISVLEIYGQSEDSGPTSSNLPGATRFGSVGRPLPGVEVRIGGDDEILVRGPNVFAGYFKDEEATAATLVDGWLHSGDLGRFDDDGYLFITGRAKDIIITSGGKNIAPKNIEGALTSLELVSQAVCVGEQQRFLVALLTLDPDAAARFAAEHGIAVETVHEHPALLDRLGSEIAERVNPQFARVEHIRNFAVLPEQFSIEGGELTPTFKIKRALVNARYTEQIDALYEDGQKL